MNKKVNMIIGTGVLGAYLSSFLLNKNEKVIVTSRSLIKKISNYEALKNKKFFSDCIFYFCRHIMVLSKR